MFRSRSIQGALLLSLASTPALGSCVADSVSLRISCNIVPESDCTYESGGACYLDGALNLASSRNRYHAVLLVANGLKSRARDVPPQAEPNGVTVKELEIEVTDSAGRKPNFRTYPNPFTVQATGTVEPGEDAPVGAELLPAPYIAALRELKLSSVRLSIIARGKTWGNVEVESAAWPWSIQLISVSEDPSSTECVQVKDDICTLGQDRWANACIPLPDEGT
jgi:hypothetical protein